MKDINITFEKILTFPEILSYHGYYKRKLWDHYYVTFKPMIKRKRNYKKINKRNLRTPVSLNLPFYSFGIHLSVYYSFLQYLKKKTLLSLNVKLSRDIRESLSISLHSINPDHDKKLFQINTLNPPKKSCFYF